MKQFNLISKHAVLFFVVVLVLSLVTASCSDFFTLMTGTDSEGQATDAEIVADDKAALDITFSGTDTLTSVTGNLTLPTSGSAGSTITWASDTETVVAADGTVTRPAFSDGDATVVMTATITNGTVSETKTFTLTVIKADPITYSIGDIGPSGVGIVVYISDGGLHGLEVASEDQATSAAWSDVTATLIGTTHTASGTGSANTDAIIGQDGHTASAAQICRDYHGGGLTDWYLPSQVELINLIPSKDTIGMGSGNYWSSSEVDEDEAYAIQMWNPSQTVIDPFKSATAFRVRAMRSF